MRALIRAFDGWLSRRLGIYPFTQDPDCILRLQQTRAPHALQLADIAIHAGDPLLVLHLWNERVPPLPPGGADLAWAARTWRLFSASLRQVGTAMAVDPCLTGVCAVMAATVLLGPPPQAGRRHPMQNLGFTLLPYRSRLGRFGEYWEDCYTWWVMWAYNPPSVRGRSMLDLRRAEMWMSAGEFRARYGRPVALRAGAAPSSRVQEE